MCKAGIPVLDIYHLSASYPGGTLDHVHYPNHVFRSAEDLLEESFAGRWRHTIGAQDLQEDTSEIRIWRHFHWSAFVTMDV